MQEPKSPEEVIEVGDSEGNFQLEDFEIHSEDNSQVLLGKGSFAAVYLARRRADQKLYALKVVG
jgi:hypothetical protein